MAESMPEYLSVLECAKVLRVTPATVRELAHHGELPAIKAGREWRISARALAERAGVGSAKETLAERIVAKLLPRISVEINATLASAFGQAAKQGL